MKKVILTIVCALGFLNASAWSQKGHDVTAYIAEKHLTPATKAAVDSILEGKSMVYWANWLDNASHQSEMAYTKTWHYKNIDANVDYDQSPLNEKGDVIRAIESQVKILSDASTTPEQAALAMKILVHCMGDMHQPMHMGHLSDLGGNKTKVKFFNRDTNLHSIWDSSLVESGHKWSYTEWQDQIDRATAEEEAQILSGTVNDWGKETYEIAGRCYKYFRPGSNVMYDQVAAWTPVIEQQLLRGGLRLAHVLNNIYYQQYNILYLVIQTGLILFIKPVSSNKR
ncbi:MAG: S1/P1 nuclease [Muribaculaceae bacterium]